MIGDDGEFNSVAGIQTVATALDFRHMEEEFLAFIHLIIKEAKLTFDGINNSAFLLTNSGHLKFENMLIQAFKIHLLVRSPRRRGIYHQS